jgi:hypothetical protein
MQTFRAYLAGPGGTIAWAAWIEAVDQSAAELRAHALCSQGVPTVDLWSAAARLPHSAYDLEAV